ncbi:MAG: hypothetical protein DKINENOH_02156 [bacterium]|nr:hypothetical protein [bacterium]
MQRFFEYSRSVGLTKLLLLCVLLMLPAAAFAQFTDIGASLTGVYKSSVAWGDYDNDGDLDILLTGLSDADAIAKVYQNTGGIFSDIGAGLTGVWYSSVTWGDYDNDGDLDILLTGADVSLNLFAKVYQNTGGTFTDIGAGLTAVYRSSVAWGDYDNDGDLDILLTGHNGTNSIAKVYQNTGGAFADISAGLTWINRGSVAWGDYDNDGDLDILLPGNSDAGYFAKVYQNNSGVFTGMSAGLTAVGESSAAWGDYDNDGDIDILLTGETASGRIAKVYQNSGGAFTDIGAGLSEVGQGSVAWGDYDNDGDLDILLTGETISGRIARVYQNSGGAFTDIGAGLTGVLGSSVAWGDYDNDGDLDILLTGQGAGFTDVAKIYRNNSTVSNTVPSAPGNLSEIVNGHAVALSWDAASDAQTPSAGLTYNLMVGTTSNGVDINSPMANVSNGWRRVVQLGGTNHNESWTLKNLPDGDYFWRVQAVDAAFAGSPFSAEGVFSVGPEMDVQGNSVSIADGDVTPSAADHTDFGAADLTSGSVDRTFTIANLGNVNLNLTGAPMVQITGANAGDFAVTADPTSPVAANGGATTFTVHFNPSAVGLRSATISIANDDSDENPYDFAIQGTGTGAAEMGVRGKGISIADGDDTPSLADGTDFGTVVVGQSGGDMHVIYNTGTANLNLTGTPAVQISGPNAADFSLSTLYSTTIAPGGNTEFHLVFAPSAPGLRTATVTIPNNDPDENPYDFAIQGTGTVAIRPFVFLANKVTLKQTKQSTPAGDTHSNGAMTVEKGDPSTYNSNLTAIGKITIYKDNTINGNVRSQTSISNSGKINGTKTIGPVANEPLPSLSYNAGGPNKTVPQDGAVTLAPGSYGIVTINARGSLKLSSGEYFMNELCHNGSQARIKIDLSSGDPITINVVNKLQLGKEVAIQLLPNGESDSKLVTFNTRQSGAMSIGKEAYLLGSFNAPHANVTLLKNSQLHGAIVAKEILVERDCLFLHHDSPGSLPGPGKLPKAAAVEEEEVNSDQLPVTSHQLEQNYPNPFNPSTVISFQLPVPSEVRLAIFNLSGQLVKQVASGRFAGGRHEVVWDGKNDRGEAMASGVYLYVLKAGEFVAQRKLVLMK